ncbi:zinc finger protein 135-like isoform X3 [Dermacentor albipictus]|uniref:zinc finger protein 135-like isoform X3 n=1 Tax=Dermacentor albipictus TaxID=60249 RepID=UPI0038FD1623
MPLTSMRWVNSSAVFSDGADATDSGSTNYASVVSTASAVHAWPRTSHAGIEKLSSTTRDTASCSEEAWRCQLNAQHRPIADQTYSLDGAYSSGSPSLLQLGPTSSIDHKKPSTSRAGMVEASASLQYGARNPQTTRVQQSNTQYYTTARTSTIEGYAHNRHTGSTSFTLPVYSSSGGGKYAVASTSHAGSEEASGILGNGARIPDAAGTEPWSTQYYVARGTTTVSGHTHVSQRGMTSSLHMVSSSSVNHAQPSASRAGIEEASAVPENFARIPDATGAEPWGTHYYAASGTTTVYDVSCSRSTTCLHLESTSSIDHTLPSTSCAGMMEASASLQYDASSQYNAYEQHACVPEAFRMETFPQRDLPSANEAITPQKSWSSQHTSHSSMFADHFQGHANSTGSGSAGFTLPVYSSSSGGGSDDSVACTSHAGMQEASGMSGNETRNATRSGGRGHQQLSGVSGNVSSRRDALRGHDNQHTGDTAPICKARDQSSVKLSEFVECCRIRDAKKHECEICGKLFHRARHLDVHKRTHTGEKPYNCEICGASFARNWALSRHQVTHTDEKPHVCHKCSKSFKAKRYLKDHLKSCCRKGAFICEKCDESFIDNSHLRHHYARVHGHIILPE